MVFEMDFWLNTIMLFLLGVVAFSIARSKNILVAIILFGIFSLLMAVEYLILGAPDVAITEASVGAGISTMLLLWALSLIGNEVRKDAVHPKGDQVTKAISLIVASIMAAGLIYATKDLPGFSTPSDHSLVQYYVEQTPKDIGISNIVTAILASYRGYDTFGEVAVIFTAAIAVLLIFSREQAIKIETIHKEHIPIVAKVVVRFLAPFIFIYALCLQLYGENAPGGGFQAGIIAASVYIAYGLVFGFSHFKSVISWWVIRTFCATGVLLYAGVGLVTIIEGGSFLEYGVLSSSYIAGQKLGIFIIELGVGATVFGAMMIFYYAFLTRISKQ